MDACHTPMGDSVMTLAMRRRVSGRWLPVSRHLSLSAVLVRCGRLLAGLVALWWVVVAPVLAAPQDRLPPSQREIVVGLLADYAPFQSWPVGTAQPGGYDVDLLEHLAQRQGWRLRFRRYADFGLLQQALREGRVDVLTSMAQTPARSAEMAFSRPYVMVPQLLLGRESIHSSSSAPDLAGRSLALVNGFASSENALERFPLASIQIHQDLEGAIRAVREGRADLVFESQPVLQRFVGPQAGLRLLRSYSMPIGHLRLATRLSDRPLHEQLDAAVARIDPGLRARWARTWLSPSVLPEPEASADGVTDPGLRVGFVPSDPLSLQHADGQPRGLGVDLLEAVLGRAGLAVDSYRAVNPADGMALLRGGELDLLLGLHEVAERRQDISFVGPFHSSLLALVSRRGFGISDLDQLAGRKLGVIQGFHARPHLARLHPGVELVACEDLDDCLRMLEQGEVDATVYKLAGLQDRLQQRGSQLQVSGFVPSVPDEDSLALGAHVAHLAPRLRTALDLVIANDLPGIERNDALRRSAGAYTWRDLLPWLLGALAVVLLASVAVWWHVSRLQRQARKKQEARERAEAYLAFMTHEVRNALQAVVGATVLMGEPDIDADPAQRRHLRRLMRRSARSTMALMDTLLDRHRGRHGQLDLRAEPCDLGRLVQTLVEDLRPAAEAKKLRLVASVPDSDTAFVMADATRVQQVLRNLVINAIKFTRTGEILVQLDVAPLTGDARHDRMVHLLVRDTGEGMSEEQVRQLFKVAHTQGGDRPGSGLGLLLCRELAQLMDGRIRVESRPGHGSSFHFSFGTVWAAPPDTVPSPADARVLVVEPSADYGELLQLAFVRAGVPAQRVTDVQAATEALRSRESFHLVLCARNVFDDVPADLLHALAVEQQVTGRVPSLVILENEADGPRPTLPGVAGTCMRSGDMDGLVKKALRLAQRHQQAATPTRPASGFDETDHAAL